MNKKLKEIASNYWDDDYFTDFDKSGNMRHFLNEYGKHIIRECAHVALMSNGNNLHVCELIKQHFGFEE
jgi:hypothetical protein